MTDEELKQLVASNARAIQAMIEQRVTDKLNLEEKLRTHEERIARLEELTLRLTRIEEAQNRMLASIDEDRHSY